MSSLSVDCVYGEMSNALRTTYRIRGLPMAYGYKATCTTQSGGEVYISTGLHSPQMGLAIVRGSTNSQSMKWETHSILQWVRGTGSYAIFRVLMVSANATWCCVSQVAINWLAFEL